MPALLKQDVDSPQLLSGLGYSRLDFFQPGHIYTEGQRLAAQGENFLRHSLGTGKIDIAQRGVRASLSEHLGRCSTDARARAGNERDFSSNSWHAFPPLPT